MKAVVTFVLLISGFCSPAFAGTTFQVTRCQNLADRQMPAINLQFARQLRSADDAFVPSGLFQTDVNLVESPTTLGKIEASGQSSMTWKRGQQGGEAAKLSAVSEDGSVIAASTISAQVFSDNLQALVPNPIHFNDVLLYAFKLKVNSPVVDYLSITLQGIDFSRRYHILISGINKGGVHPFAQFDVDCTTEVSNSPLF